MLWLWHRISARTGRRRRVDPRKALPHQSQEILAVVQVRLQLVVAVVSLLVGAGLFAKMVTPRRRSQILRS